MVKKSYIIYVDTFFYNTLCFRDKLNTPQNVKYTTLHWMVLSPWRYIQSSSSR